MFATATNVTKKMDPILVRIHYNPGYYRIFFFCVKNNNKHVNT